MVAPGNIPLCSATCNAPYFTAFGLSAYSTSEKTACMPAPMIRAKKLLRVLIFVPLPFA
jgi:hypothetical protein